MYFATNVFITALWAPCSTQVVYETHQVTRMPDDRIAVTQAAVLLILLLHKAIAERPHDSSRETWSSAAATRNLV